MTIANLFSTTMSNAVRMENEQRKTADGYLTKPVAEVPICEYYQMLGELPPLEYVSTKGGESFVVGEFECDGIARQYALYKVDGTDQAFMKFVRVGDRSTYM